MAGAIASIPFELATRMRSAEIDGWTYALDLARARAADANFQDPP